MPATPFERFLERWQGCTACTLATARKRMVFCRGRVPAEVLFVGEGPGESEDVLGSPFMGPAGKDPTCGLDRIIREGLKGQYTYCITNLVCCIPRLGEGGHAAPPLEEHVEACSIRLQEFAGLVKPKLVIAVGQVAADFLKPGYLYSVLPGLRVPLVEIAHPAGVLRRPMAARSIATRRSIISVIKALENVQRVIEEEERHAIPR